MTEISEALHDLEHVRRELAECREQLAVARDDSSRFARALEQSHDRYVELSERHEELVRLQTADVERELEAIMATKTFRWLRQPRRFWGVLIRQNR